MAPVTARPSFGLAWLSDRRATCRDIVISARLHFCRPANAFIAITTADIRAPRASLNGNNRMFHRIIATVVVIVALTMPAKAQNPPSKPTPVTPVRSSTYLCTESTSAGVKYNENSGLWEGGSLEAQGKFMVRIELVRQRTVFGRPGEPPIAAGADYRTTTTLPVSNAPGPERRPCVPHGGESELVAIVGDNEIVCRVRSYELALKLSTGRFILTNRAGFIDGRDASGNTPSISIGNCIRISD